MGGVVAVFLIALIAAIIVAVFAGSQDVASVVAIVRDLFIILLALQGMLIAITIIVLILQIAALINLLQNEISPIMKSLQETASTVKGTSEFLSENVTTPIIESTAWIAGARTFFREIRRFRRTDDKNASETDKTPAPEKPPATPEKKDSKPADSPAAKEVKERAASAIKSNPDTGKSDSDGKQSPQEKPDTQDQQTS